MATKLVVSQLEATRQPITITQRIPFIIDHRLHQIITTTTIITTATTTTTTLTTSANIQTSEYLKQDTNASYSFRYTFIIFIFRSLFYLVWLYIVIM